MALSSSWRRNGAASEDSALQHNDPRRGAPRPLRACSSLAMTGDFPTMPHALQIDGGSESQKTYPLVNQRESA
jgi:hypothetical protein